MADTLNDLLEQTSRSFYQTLRILPSTVRPQISLAYLLARATDTIADTELVPLAQRLDALDAMRGRILGTSTAPLNFGELARSQVAPAERKLLENCEAVLARLRDLSPADLQLTRTVLKTITSGQELDLRRFAPVESTLRSAPDQRQSIIALGTDEELDDYTYRVAGCVGEFWTNLCRAHVFPTAPLDDTRLLADGVRFGKGLQLVNVLRDLPADLRKGRCYLPADGLAALGLTPADLLRPENETRLRPLYHGWLDRAEAHLAAGWAYTSSLPWPCVRVRLACAWPILIGINTLHKLRRENMLDPAHRIKISRRDVRRLIVRSFITYPFKAEWERLFDRT